MAAEKRTSDCGLRSFAPHAFDTALTAVILEVRYDRKVQFVW